MQRRSYFQNLGATQLSASLSSGLDNRNMMVTGNQSDIKFEGIHGHTVSMTTQNQIEVST